MIETKHYSDGTSATGTAPLPDLSPDQQAAMERVTLAVEQICHDEQLRVWAGEIIAALCLDDFIRDEMTYDDGLDLERVVMREIRSIVASAFRHPGLAS